ncbi:MAG: tripartite tricarboxylate transporter substrate binding protein [Betaproteobacteria bacterium]|nr:tripartite tricarboxylate transporter substrate binding protein [Betaproteobacteria bacterium]
MQLRMWITLAACLLPLLSAAPAQAQGFPTRPLRLLVGFPPGGESDIIARVIAQKLGEGLGQPVVIENRPGASGTLAAAAVAKAPADGYTLFFVTSGHAVNTSLFAALPYDAHKDFAAVSGVAAMPVVVMVNPAATQRTTLAALLAEARAKPGKLNFGAPGSGGTLPSLAAELLRNQANVDFAIIGYKGSAPALTALLANEVDFSLSTVPGAIGQLKAGKLRAIAVTSPKRSPVLPDVPTVAEQGLPGFEVIGWFGVLAPAGTPAGVLERLNREANLALRAPDVQQRIHDLGASAMGGTADEFARLIASETARWGDVVRRLGLRAD